MVQRILLLFSVLCVINVQAKKSKGPENFVFIPSGTTNYHDKQYSCQAFWMLDHEVTNYEYRVFLADLKARGKTEEFKAALPDTIQWSLVSGFIDPMIEHYFGHPAYDDFPVVNISIEGMQMYCMYLSEIINQDSKVPYQPVRLPTKYEWTYAASGGMMQVNYPWGWNKVVDDAGIYMANCWVVGDHNITRTPEGIQIVGDSLLSPDATADGCMYTCPIRSYSPNLWGLYEICGNVAEVCLDPDYGYLHQVDSAGLVAMGGHWYSPGYDLRIESYFKFEGPNPYVGFRPVISHLNKPN